MHTVETAVEVENVSFNYARLRVVDSLSLKIPGGSSFGLLGPNGAGKTTLIRMLVGLLKPLAGSVSVGGSPPSRATAHLIGYMPQTAALYTELSVRQNIAFFASVYGVKSGRERSGRIDRAIELVELQQKRNVSVHDLSGGMKQRVSLACAIVHDPPVLFLDEPTVGLDPELRCVLWDFFRQLTRQGRTLVISSHTMDDAAHCDRLAFMRMGRIIAAGSPQELVEATGRTGATLEDAFLYYIRRGEQGVGTESSGPEGSCV
jgi:ABC-2 type transport system ATP-binding protein